MRSFGCWAEAMGRGRGGGAAGERDREGEEVQHHGLGAFVNRAARVSRGPR